MTDNMQAIDNFLDSMQMLAEKVVEDNRDTNMIECNITKLVDASRGVYQVQYLSNTFEAHTTTDSVTFSIGDRVYVLVPENDFSREKVIIGLTSAAAIIDDNIDKRDLYKIVGDIPLLKDNEKIIFDKEIVSEIDTNKNINLFNIADDKNKFNTYCYNYSKEYKILGISLDILTNFLYNNIYEGEYGFQITLPMKTKAGSIVQYTIDANSRSFEGSLYDNKNTIHQTIYFTLPNDYVYDKNDSNQYLYFKAYKKNFYNGFEDSQGNHSTITMENIRLQFFEYIPEESQGYNLYVNPSNKNYCIFESKKVNFNLKLTYKNANLDLNECSKYWFEEDEKITKTSENYSIYGGEGWKCLNDVLSKNSTNNNTVYQPSYLNSKEISINFDNKLSKRYKCVVFYNDKPITRVWKMLNGSSKYTLELSTNAANNTYTAGLGSVNITASVTGVDQNQLNQCNFVWERYDNNNLLIDTDFGTFEVKYDEGIISQQCYFPASILMQKSTILCKFYINNKLITTETVVVMVRDAEKQMTINIQNTDLLYKYDANGNSPTSSLYTGSSQQIELTPLTYILKKPNGEDYTEEEMIAIEEEGYSVQWKIPKNSLIVPIVGVYKEKYSCELDVNNPNDPSEKNVQNCILLERTLIEKINYNNKETYKLETTTFKSEGKDNIKKYYTMTKYVFDKNYTSDDKNYLIKDTKKVYYTLENQYNEANSVNGNITLVMTYNGAVFKDNKKIMFFKEGEAGVSVGEYTAVITYCGYRYNGTNENNVVQNFIPVYAQDKFSGYYSKGKYLKEGVFVPLSSTSGFQVFVYKNGQIVNNDNVSIKWKMKDEKITDNCVNIIDGKLYMTNLYDKADKSKTFESGMGANQIFLTRKVRNSKYTYTSERVHTLTVTDEETGKAYTVPAKWKSVEFTEQYKYLSNILEAEVTINETAINNNLINTNVITNSTIVEGLEEDTETNKVYVEGAETVLNCYYPIDLIVYDKNNLGDDTLLITADTSLSFIEYNNSGDGYRTDFKEAGNEKISFKINNRDVEKINLIESDNNKDKTKNTIQFNPYINIVPLQKQISGEGTEYFAYDGETNNYTTYIEGEESYYQYSNIFASSDGVLSNSMQGNFSISSSQVKDIQNVLEFLSFGEFYYADNSISYDNTQYKNFQKFVNLYLYSINSDMKPDNEEQIKAQLAKYGKWIGIKGNDDKEIGEKFWLATQVMRIVMAYYFHSFFGPFPKLISTNDPKVTIKYYEIKDYPSCATLKKETNNDKDNFDRGIDIITDTFSDVKYIDTIFDSTNISSIKQMMYDNEDLRIYDFAIDYTYFNLKDDNYKKIMDKNNNYNYYENIEVEINNTKVTKEIHLTKDISYKTMITEDNKIKETPLKELYIKLFGIKSYFESMPNPLYERFSVDKNGTEVIGYSKKYTSYGVWGKDIGNNTFNNLGLCLFLRNNENFYFNISDLISNLLSPYKDNNIELTINPKYQETNSGNTIGITICNSNKNSFSSNIIGTQENKLKAQQSNKETLETSFEDIKTFLSYLSLSRQKKILDNNSYTNNSIYCEWLESYIAEDYREKKWDTNQEYLSLAQDLFNNYIFKDGTVNVAKIQERLALHFGTISQFSESNGLLYYNLMSGFKIIDQTILNQLKFNWDVEISKINDEYNISINSETNEDKKEQLKKEKQEKLAQAERKYLENIEKEKNKLIASPQIIREFSEEDFLAILNTELEKILRTINNSIIKLCNKYIDIANQYPGSIEKNTIEMENDLYYISQHVINQFNKRKEARDISNNTNDIYFENLDITSSYQDIKSIFKFADLTDISTALNYLIYNKEEDNQDRIQSEGKSIPDIADYKSNATGDWVIKNSYTNTYQIALDTVEQSINTIQEELNFMKSYNNILKTGENQTSFVYLSKPIIVVQNSSASIGTSKTTDETITNSSENNSSTQTNQISTFSLKRSNVENLQEQSIDNIQNITTTSIISNDDSEEEIDRFYNASFGDGYYTENNNFTGLVLGHRFGTLSGKKECGLFGYHDGQQTLWLDAYTGKSTFGIEGAGQIILDPSTGEAIIRSGNYTVPYQSTYLINEDNTPKQIEGSGMEINLTNSTIRFGNGNFYVTPQGEMYCKSGNIGGCKIDGNKDGSLQINWNNINSIQLNDTTNFVYSTIDTNWQVNFTPITFVTDVQLVPIPKEDGTTHLGLQVERRKMYTFTPVPKYVKDPNNENKQILTNVIKDSVTIETTELENIDYEAVTTTIRDDSSRPQSRNLI